MAVKYSAIECDHKNNIPIKYRISNGAIQVKMFCKDCNKLHGCALKQTEFDLTRLPEASYENYQKYLQKIYEKDQGQVREYVKSLNIPEWHQLHNDYIESEEWKALRKIILERDNYNCQICNEKAKDVHHLTYKHLKNEFHFELVALCRECHQKYYYSKT